MKSFVGSIGLVRHPVDEEKRWLMKWSERNQHYRMIVAEKLEGESYRECLDRELAWELELRRGKDYLISSMSRLHIQEEMQLPTECSPTLFILEFFAVDLYGKTSKAAVEDNPHLHWLTAKEVLAGQSTAGKMIDPHLCLLLNKFELISPYA